MTGPVSAVGRTALAVAVCRGLESERDDPWFTDPVGQAILRVRPDAAQRISPGLLAWISARTRFLDELVLAAATGPTQLVIPAAGLDIRAYRLPLPAGSVVYELDRTDVFAVKRRILSRLGAAPGERSGSAAEPPARAAPLRPRSVRHEIVADLRQPDWPDRLQAAGWDPDRPTVWLVEGLLIYLEHPQRLQLLRTLADLSATGSVLGVTINSRPSVPANGLWLPVPEDESPAEWISRTGWSCTQESLAEAAARFGRPIDPAVARTSSGRLIRGVIDEDPT